MVNGAKVALRDRGPAGPAPRARSPGGVRELAPGYFPTAGIPDLPARPLGTRPAGACLSGPGRGAMPGTRPVGACHGAPSRVALPPGGERSGRGR
eukprot:3604995-Lingulodinium_polyedra.AAC.1